MIKRHVSLKSAIEKVFLYNFCYMKTMCSPGYYHSGSMATFAFWYTCMVTHCCSNGSKNPTAPLE